MRPARRSTSFPRASRWLWLQAEEYGMDEDRLYVSGHSAGGHLTAMMMAAIWPAFDRRLPKDLFKGGLAISGIYDMRPMVQVDWLNGDLRQNALLGDRWRAAFAGDIPMPGMHHFSVIDGLANPSSALFGGARRLMKLD